MACGVVGCVATCVTLAGMLLCVFARHVGSAVAAIRVLQRLADSEPLATEYLLQRLCPDTDLKSHHASDDDGGHGSGHGLVSGEDDAGEDGVVPASRLAWVDQGGSTGFDPAFARSTLGRLVATLEASPDPKLMTAVRELVVCCVVAVCSTDSTLRGHCWADCPLPGVLGGDTEARRCRGTIRVVRRRVAACVLAVVSMQLTLPAVSYTLPGRPV